MLRDDFGFPLSRLLGSWSCCIPGNAQLSAGCLPEPAGTRLPVVNRQARVLLENGVCALTCR